MIQDCALQRLQLSERVSVHRFCGGHGETRGVISLQNLDRENAFTEGDVRLLQTLANSMSVALENARMHGLQLLAAEFRAASVRVP